MGNCSCTMVLRTEYLGFTQIQKIGLSFCDIAWDRHPETVVLSRSIRKKLSWRHMKRLKIQHLLENNPEFPQWSRYWGCDGSAHKALLFSGKHYFYTFTPKSLLYDHSQATVKLRFHDPHLKNVTSLIMRDLMVLLITFLIFYSLGSSLDILYTMK